MRKSTLICAAFLMALPLVTAAQTSINHKEKQAVLNRVKSLIDANFVFAEKVKAINQSLDSLNAIGRYQSITNYAAFADALTDDLVAITSDKHFKIQYNPTLVKGRRKEQELANQAAENPTEEVANQEAFFDWNLFYAKKENYGFEKIEILAGNVGYIKFDFWNPLDWIKPKIDAAMTFLADTDALIIDLTENGGGYSPSDSYLGSYFFSDTSVLWMSSYERPTEETTTSHTFKKVGAKRYLNRPVYILVSENSFSLAEQFTYALKHFGKATVVGQSSAGAAHAIDFLELNDNFLIQLPIIRSIHPVTQKDWELAGVIPHLTTKKGEEIKAAHLHALDILIEAAQKEKYERLEKRYEKIKVELNEVED